MYEIYTQNGYVLDLDLIYGEDQFTITASDISQEVSYTEKTGNTGAISHGEFRTPSRSLVVEGYIPSENLKNKTTMIKLTQQAKYLRNKRTGDMARVIATTTPIQWVTGAYDIIGQLTITFQVLSTYFLGSQLIEPIEEKLTNDQLIITYPVIDHFAARNYKLYIYSKHTVYDVITYGSGEPINLRSQYGKTYWGRFRWGLSKQTDNSEIKIPVMEKNRVVAYDVSPDPANVIINTVEIKNQNYIARLDGTLSYPSVLGRVYDTIRIDTANGSVDGRMDVGDFRRLEQYIVRGSRFNPIQPDSKMVLSLRGINLDRVQCVLYAVNEEIV